MTLYVVAEGIVYRLLNQAAPDEECIDPFDGSVYRVGTYEGGLDLNNFCDWQIFDCENACEALLLAIGCSEAMRNRDVLGRLAKKVAAQMSLRDWILSDGASPYTPNKKQAEWMVSWLRRRENLDLDPYDIGPLDWIRVADIIPYTTSPKVMLGFAPRSIRDYVWERVRHNYA